jgi:predicted transcriptional regulator
MCRTDRIGRDVYLRAEELAEQTNRTRSRLYSDALGEYLARHVADAVTTGMNEALAGIEERPDARWLSCRATRSIVAAFQRSSASRSPVT